MKNFKKRLLKTRLMSAVLATAELANVGMTSYAMMPSDSEVVSGRSEKEAVRVIDVGEMKKMNVEDLFEYLKVGSTEDELRRYCQNGTLDKTRQDIENFNSLSEEKKNELFGYVAELAYEDKLKGFTELPMNIRTEFFEFILKQNYDLRPILSALQVNEEVCLKTLVVETYSIMTPRVAGLVFGKLNKGKNLAMDAIANDDMIALLDASVQLDFDYNEEIELSWRLIDYAVLIGNVGAFKFLMLNGATITETTKECALISENMEIIHLVEPSPEGYSTVSNNLNVLRGLMSADRKDILYWLQNFSGKVKNEDIFIRWCEEESLPFLVDWVRDVCPGKMFNEAIRKTGTSLQEEMVKIFLANGVNVNKLDCEEEDTALICAVRKENIDLVRLLLANGADVNVTNHWGDTALMWAIEVENVELVQLLLDNGADVNAREKNGVTALLLAANEEKTEMVKFLLANGADVNVADDNGMTALMWTVEAGNEEFVQFLLANGADVNALHVDEKTGAGQTALMVAVDNGFTDMARLLLENGADVNAAVPNGVTALFGAAAKGDTVLVRTLLANGADVNVADKNGMTALMWAVARRNAGLALVLLENGVDVNAETKNGCTALMWATKEEKTEIVQLLLENGADVNVADKNEMTALMWAVVKNSVELVETLLANGADVNLVSENGEAALDIAIRNGNSDLIKLLKANGATE